MGEPVSDFRREAPELFISYASVNLDRASALATRLAAEGFRVWFDKARLAPGCDWHGEIEKGCGAARVVAPLLTPNWKLSEWTRYETYDHAAVTLSQRRGCGASAQSHARRSAHSMPAQTSISGVLSG